METEDMPHALRSLQERERRAALIASAHMQPLTDYLSRLKASLGPGFDTPSFDPCDGGVSDHVLILLEAPGPQAVGSGFISRNNPDPTAKNLCELLANAQIPRTATLIWNVVPYYVGANGRIRAVNREDRERSAPYLLELISLLPNLQVVLFMGRQAQRMEQAVRVQTPVSILMTHHPSNQVFHVWPNRKAEVAEVFQEVAALIHTQG